MTTHKDSGIEWIGTIPSSWDVKPLFAVGEPVKSKNRQGQNANLLSLSYGEIKEKDIDSTDGLLPESFDTYQEIKPGDLVFRFTDLQNDKRSLRSAVTGFNGIITSAYLAFRPKAIDSKYLGYLMRSYDTPKVFYAMGSGLRQSLKYSDVRRMPVLVPPIEEQKAIADFLDRELNELDALVQKMEKFVTLLEERLHSELVQATTRDFEQARRDGWSVKKLGLLFRTIGSGTTPTASDEANFGGETPWVTTGELRENLILETQKYISDQALRNFSALRIYPAGSLVLALYGATIGRLAFLGVPAAVNQACCVMANPKNCEPRFIYYALQASRDRLMAAAVGSGQPNISQEIVRQFKLPLPPLEEQRDIASDLDRAVASAQALVQTAQQTLHTLGLRRQALVSAAVNGKIDIRGKS